MGFIATVFAVALGILLIPLILWGFLALLWLIPVGLVIWWLIKPRYGATLAAAGVGSILLATVFGFGLGTDVLAGIRGPGAELYQAFVRGALIHVVFHQGRHDHTHE